MEGGKEGKERYKLEINNRRKTIQIYLLESLNFSLDSYCIKEEIKMKSVKHFESNHNL